MQAVGRYLWKRSQATPTLAIVLTLLFVELALLLRSGVLILLVLRHEVVHVRLSLRELHLVHACPHHWFQDSSIPALQHSPSQKLGTWPRPHIYIYIYHVPIQVCKMHIPSICSHVTIETKQGVLTRRAFAGVPVQESLPAEHGREVLGHAFEHLLGKG